MGSALEAKITIRNSCPAACYPIVILTPVRAFHGSISVKLEYDPSKVNSKMRNCAKYAHSPGQSANSAAAAMLEFYWFMLLTWQYMGSWLQFAIATVAERPVSSDTSVNARVGKVRGRSHLRQVVLGARV